MQQPVVGGWTAVELPSWTSESAIKPGSPGMAWQNMECEGWLPAITRLFGLLPSPVNELHVCQIACCWEMKK